MVSRGSQKSAYEKIAIFDSASSHVLSTMRPSGVVNSVAKPWRVGDIENITDAELTSSSAVAKRPRDASCLSVVSVEFYLYPNVGTVLIHSIKPELTE